MEFGFVMQVVLAVGGITILGAMRAQRAGGSGPSSPSPTR